ncbi:MAG TPA: hypothetical protein VHC47_03100, partial [Mucilaginibacter sp.]|nr:hypothetical protein [Mucilaginibacter sp.]
HLKTFTADYRMLPYYQEVDKDFKKNFKETVSQYTPFDDANREKLQQQIDKVSTVIAKLDKDFALVLHKSLAAYAEHVKQADMSILANFIFPLPIPGLTE